MTPTTLMPLIITDLQLSIALAPIPISIGKLFYVLFLIPGGSFIDTYGPRTSLLTGLTLLFLTTLMYSFVISTFFELILLHIFLALSSSLCGIPTHSVLIAEWFVTNIGIAIGIIISAFSLAGVFIPPVIAYIAQLSDWNTSVRTVASLILFIAIPVTYFGIFENRNTTDSNESSLTNTETDSVSDEINTEIVELVVKTIAQEQDLLDQESSASKDNAFDWICFSVIATSYFSLQYCYGSFGENLMLYLAVDCNVTLSYASLFFVTLNLSAFCSKLIAGVITEFVSNRFILAISSNAIASAGILCLFLPLSSRLPFIPQLSSYGIPQLPHHELSIIVFCIVFGLGYGACFNCLYSIPTQLYAKSNNLGKLTSLLFGIGLLGNACGAVFTSTLRAHLGSYSIPFLVSLVVSLLNIILLMELWRICENNRLDFIESAGDENVMSSVFSGPKESMKELIDHLSECEPLLSESTTTTTTRGGGDKKRRIHHERERSISIPKDLHLMRGEDNSQKLMKYKDQWWRLLYNHEKVGNVVKRPNTLHDLIESGVVSAAFEFPPLNVNQLRHQLIDYHPNYGDSIRFGNEFTKQRSSHA